MSVSWSWQCLRTRPEELKGVRMDMEVWAPCLDCRLHDPIPEKGWNMDGCVICLKSRVQVTTPKCKSSKIKSLEGPKRVKALMKFILVAYIVI